MKTMTREEKKYFAKLEKASKNNPMVRVEAAADFINRFLTQAFTTPRGINGDGLCYLLSALTGVAVADISKKMSLVDMFNGSFSSQMELDTEAGKFIVGDTINKYLYNSPMSAINIVEFMYSQKNGKDNLPDLENMIKENADNFGNPDYRVWDGNKNPYMEVKNAHTTYQNLVNKLEPYKLSNEEIVSVFAMALGQTIVNVARVFPREMNCLNMSLKTVMFYAHMDV